VKTSGIIRIYIAVASKNFVVLFNCIKFNTFDGFLSMKFLQHLPLAPSS